MLTDDYGKDLASVETLIRRHEELERDLTAIEDKLEVCTIGASKVIKPTSYTLITHDVSPYHRMYVHTWAYAVQKKVLLGYWDQSSDSDM